LTIGRPGISNTVCIIRALDLNVTNKVSRITISVKLGTCGNMYQD
jgi:hypothetical protein